MYYDVVENEDVINVSKSMQCWLLKCSKACVVVWPLATERKLVYFGQQELSKVVLWKICMQKISPPNVGLCILLETALASVSI